MSPAPSFNFGKRKRICSRVGSLRGLYERIKVHANNGSRNFEGPSRFRANFLHIRGLNRVVSIGQITYEPFVGNEVRNKI